MIPVKLTVSNFTSYGDIPQELDFTRFHTAAISGSNGAGKSSLLDAITWCVWGTSRLGDNSDSLIRLGQTAMWVEFSFQLDSHIFTIKRTRSSRSAGSTSLELTSGFTDSPLHNLTEGTIKATQQKIVDILHLSYETFVNSAFIRQGHADEFTTKGATDRKRILADILGLSHYDELEEKAKERSKELQTKLSLLEYQLLEIEAELSQKEQREKRLSEAEGEAQKAEDELKKVEAEIKMIESERETINVKFQSLLEKQRLTAAIQKELEDLKLQVELKNKAQSEYQEVLSRREEVESSYLSLEKLRVKKKLLDAQRSELIKLKDQWAEFLRVVKERDEKRTKAVSGLQIQIKELQTQNTRFQSEIDHLITHKDNCPTCNQPIGIEKNREIITKNQKCLAENNQQIAELEGKVKRYQDFDFEEQKSADEREKQIKVIETETKDYFEVNQKLLALEKYNELYSRLQQAQTAVKTQQEAIADLQKLYQNKQSQLKEVAIDAQQLRLLEDQLLKIKQRVDAQVNVKQELAGKASSLRSQVGEARQLVSRAKQLSDLESQKKSEKGKLAKEKEAFDELSLAFGKKGIQAMIIETAIPEIEEETNRLLDRLTEGQMRIALVTQKETRTKIAGTGEKGLVETLDIIISDEMGERPYEVYSGGEQFRVNLAIRLALSRLLTNRAGSKLQFLVVDEGFGTQDTQGIARIIEALNAIQNEFEKIVVITHLDELKEEFPARIEVSKGSTGSRFELINS